MSDSDCGKQLKERVDDVGKTFIESTTRTLLEESGVNPKVVRAAARTAMKNIPKPNDDDENDNSIFRVNMAITQSFTGNMEEKNFDIIYELKHKLNSIFEYIKNIFFPKKTIEGFTEEKKINARFIFMELIQAFISPIKDFTSTNIEYYMSIVDNNVPKMHENLIKYFYNLFIWNVLYIYENPNDSKDPVDKSVLKNSLVAVHDQFITNLATKIDDVYMKRYDNDCEKYESLYKAVSYTHLTLPTNREV